MYLNLHVPHFSTRTPLPSNTNNSPRRNCPPSWKTISNKPSLENNQTNIAPKNGWLEDNPFFPVWVWKVTTFTGKNLLLSFHGWCRCWPPDKLLWLHHLAVVKVRRDRRRESTQVVWLDFFCWFCLKDVKLFHFFAKKKWGNTELF